MASPRKLVTDIQKPTIEYALARNDSYLVSARQSHKRNVHENQCTTPVALLGFHSGTLPNQYSASSDYLTSHRQCASVGTCLALGAERRTICQLH